MCVHVHIYIYTRTHIYRCSLETPVVQVPPTTPRNDSTTFTNQIISSRVVGGTTLGGAPLTAGNKQILEAQKHGERGNDIGKKRKQSTCRRCISNGVPVSEALECSSRASRGNCKLQCANCGLFTS